MRKVIFNETELKGLCKYFVHNGSQIKLYMEDGLIIVLDNKLHKWNIDNEEVRFNNLK